MNVGVLYALVHDSSREAFELGKGVIWCEWRNRAGDVGGSQEGLPTSKSALEAELREWSAGECKDPNPPDADILWLAEQLWAFIESHPGCRIVDDGVNYWTPNAAEAADENAGGGDSVWLQVGSRYADRGVAS